MRLILAHFPFLCVRERRIQWCDLKRAREESNLIAIFLIGHEELRTSFWGICQRKYLTSSFIWLNVINFSRVIDFWAHWHNGIRWPHFAINLRTAVPSSNSANINTQPVYHIGNLIYPSFTNSNTRYMCDERLNESSIIKRLSSLGILH